MLIQRFHPHVGGAERQLQSLIPKLAERGVQVGVLTRRHAELPARDGVAGALVYRAPMPGGRVAAALVYTLATLGFLLRHRRRIDVLHAHELLSPTTAAVLGKLLLRRPVIAKAVRGGWLGDVEVLRAARLGRFRLWLYARLVDRFVTISDEIDRELVAAGVPRERIVRIANGVDIDRFHPLEAAQRANLRHELGLGGRPTVLFVGRLAAEKGLDDLLQAWPTVMRAQPDAVLLLAGDGPERARLEARGLPGIRFLGEVEDPAPYLQVADCFVLPSSSEGLSNALLEALASGVACVATGIGGTVDAVRDGVEGLLVPPRDPGALADALVRALSPDSRAGFGRAARERMIREYSLDQTADRLVGLYRELRAQGAP
jgi:glycosyltransferase involved in cell wall biosynthesis